MDVNQFIWAKFHVKKGDNLPFYSWRDDSTRLHLSESFAELGFSKGAEVGVRAGEFSKKLLDMNPKLHLYLVDPWAPYGRVSEGRQGRYFRMCQRMVANYIEAKRVTFIVATSMDALKEIPDGSLDFVYIDGMHEFDFVMQDIIGWSYKVRSGGIVSGHDYAHVYNQGVVQAVEAYTHAHHITQWYVTREREGADNRAPSWFWVKP